MRNQAAPENVCSHRSSIGCVRIQRNEKTALDLTILWLLKHRLGVDRPFEDEDEDDDDLLRGPPSSFPIDCDRG